MSEEPHANTPAADEAMPVRRSVRRPLMLIACGVIIAALLLVVVMSVDAPGPADPAADEPDNVVEIVEPGRIDEQRLADGDSATASAIPGVRGGGWIQVSDENGQLAQQYRFDSLDPNPPGRGPGWLNMVRPVLQLYGSDGSVTTLTGDTALAHAPRRAIESGTLTGNVRIRRFAAPADGPADPETDTPSLMLRTDEASLDSILGEVRCDGAIHLETTGAEFRGRALKLLINDRDNVIQQLSVREVEFIRLAADRTVQPVPAHGIEDAPPPPPSSAQKTGPPRDEHREPGASPGTRAPAREPARHATPDDVQYYRAVLHDNIRVQQGAAAAQRTARGDSLSVIFTLDRGDVGANLASASRSDRIMPPEARTPTMPRSIAVLITTMPFAAYQSGATSLAPPPSDDDTYVYCDSGLTMTPLVEIPEALPEPGDALLELLGRPVRLEDPSDGMQATCASLQYRTGEERFDLIASRAHPLVIDSPELHATGDRFWLAQPRGIGGMTGPGRMRFREIATPDSPDSRDASAAPAPERMRITWAEQVDLAFDAGQRAQRDALGSLRRAVFIGDVHVHGEDMSLDLADAETASAAARLAASDARATAGDLDCHRLTINMTADAGGRTAPESLLAAGEVRLTDRRQTVWSESFRARFAPPAEDGVAAPAPERARRAELDEVVAETNVQLLLAHGRRVFADMMRIDPRARYAELIGSDVRLVDGNNLIEHARRITADDRAQTYQVHGKGRFRRFDRPVFDEVAHRIEGTTLSRLDEFTEELRVTWREGVSIRPDVSEATAATPRNDVPQVAVFRGEVQVASPELKLTHADEMAVRFAAETAEGSQDRAIQSIDATGSVRVRAVGRDGAIGADHLHVAIAPGADGEPVPRQMLADGHIRIAEGGRSLWADTLDATFRERPPGEGQTPGTEHDPEFAEARVALEKVVAEGDVQLRSETGQRVFADRFVADEVRKTRELFGKRVLVVSDEFVLDRGEHLVLDEPNAVYESRGPGVCYAFAESVPLPDRDAPIAIPPLDGERSFQASWTDSAEYIETADTLTLRGAVRGESRPTPLEYNLLGADALTLSFVDVESPEESEPRKDLQHLLARGDAWIESRTWLDEAGGDPPRVYRVDGQHIDYDQQTRQATVIGDGELLIHDVRPEADASPAESGSARGTSYFQWTRKLHLTPIVEDVFTVTMTGDVRGMRRELDRKWTKFSGQSFQATLERELDGDGAAPPPAPGAVDLGGPVKIKRLLGSGAIVVETPQRLVTCDEFDYNVITGLAQLSAAPGRTVSIQTGDIVRPLRAEHILWDMKRDTITITRAAGTGAPR